MNYVMLPAYISKDMNSKIMDWLDPFRGSWMFDNKPGEPAKLVFLEEEMATIFKLTFSCEELSQ
jgi:hypothetical protein